MSQSAEFDILLNLLTVRKLSLALSTKAFVLAHLKYTGSLYRLECRSRSMSDARWYAV